MRPAEFRISTPVPEKAVEHSLSRGEIATDDDDDDDMLLFIAPANFII